MVADIPVREVLTGRRRVDQHSPTNAPEGAPSKLCLSGDFALNAERPRQAQRTLGTGHPQCLCGADIPVREILIQCRREPPCSCTTACHPEEGSRSPSERLPTKDLCISVKASASAETQEVKRAKHLAVANHK